MTMMMGRKASIPVITFLVGWMYLFTNVEATTVEPMAGEVEAEAILDRASAWIWSKRDKDAGWGNQTHRAVLVLRLRNLSRDDNVTPPVSLELQLSAKQMELEIVMLLWRHREVNFRFPLVQLARYALALNAMCMDPRQFHGHDLIGTLQHYETPTHYEFALTTLAACNAQAHIRKRQIRRLLDIAYEAQFYDVDPLAMVILALRCIAQDHRHRNLHHFIRKPSMELAMHQRLDGSFGDLKNTALALQALEDMENEPYYNWNRTAALSWLVSQQRADGSFAGDIRVTLEVMLGIVPRRLATVRTLDCAQGFTDNLPFFGINDGASTAAEVSHESIISSTLIASDSTISDNTITSTTVAPIMVNISYTLWVGSNVNETYNLTVTAAKNETFYEVMTLASEMSPHFQFVTSEWPNGHYVHTLAGYKEEPMTYHYWLLYRLPSAPEPSSPPGNQLVAPGGVDDLQISDGEHYLYWYKQL